MRGIQTDIAFICKATDTKSVTFITKITRLQSGRRIWQEETKLVNLSGDLMMFLCILYLLRYFLRSTLLSQLLMIENRDAPSQTSTTASVITLHLDVLVEAFKA